MAYVGFGPRDDRNELEMKHSTINKGKMWRWNRGGGGETKRRGNDGGDGNNDDANGDSGNDVNFSDVGDGGGGRGWRHWR